MEVTAHVTLEEVTDARYGRNRACMKAIAYLTEQNPDFGPQTELVDVTARQGKSHAYPDGPSGYFKVEVTYLAESRPFETENIDYPNL